MNLTDDIWFEIFLHLPMKSIYRFRCVSKVWLSLLSEPSFINQWIQINTPSPWTVIHSTFDKQLSFAYLDSHSKLFSSHDGFSFKFLNQIGSDDYSSVGLGASNGLVLCISEFYRRQYLYVCNPLTQKRVLLPLLPEGKEPLWCVTAFVCNTSTDYKVIRIPEFKEASNTFKVEIFSAELGAWNVYQVLCPEAVTWQFPMASSALVINKGILYWIEGKNKMISYSLSQKNEGHTCELYDLPDHDLLEEFWDPERKDISFAFNRCLGEAEGLICLGVIDTLKETLNVWVFSEEKWHVLHKDVRMGKIISEIETKLRSLYNLETQTNVLSEYGVRVAQMLGFNPMDKNVVIFNTRSYVWAYNIRTGSYEELCHPLSFDEKDTFMCFMCFPCVLQTTPTILPPPSWTEPSVVRCEHE